ncbi:MAG TPA: prolyl oligopeptidase family serine peptidase [Thermoanaerobaculia bacterium]|jgi:pimeloyl-ACP methyl ester carboxylesterase|nr:prolyl oligopeptidase family serine peptidase [Thermoanaerobaculia bacterium]
MIAAEVPLMRVPTVVALSVAAVLAFSSARAEEKAWHCTNYEGEPIGPIPLTMSYLVDEHAPANDTRADANFDKNGKPHWRIDLKGHVWLPDAATRKAHAHPVLVYNHGHDSTQPPCAIVNFFRNNGFLVFAPLRRGQGVSTGVFIADYAKACDDCDEQEVYDARETMYLQKQSEDIVDAVKWISKNDYADPDEIVILGHSYGGMAVLYANTLFPKLEKGQHRAIIDISGGELTWDRNQIIHATLPAAVANGRYPILFLQPANGVSLGSTFNLVKVARKDDRAHIYPPIDIKDKDDDVHTRFIKSRDQVFDGWGQDALEFLARHKIK